MMQRSLGVLVALAILSLGPTTALAELVFRAKTDFIAGGAPRAVAIADLNKDGIPDMAVANEASATVSVLLGNGDGTFRVKADLAAGGGAASVVIQDLDTDGSLDLAVANYESRTVSILLGNGDGSFRTKTDIGAVGTCYSMAIGDLNGDAIPDLVTPIYANEVYVRLGNGDGTFGAVFGYETGSGSYAAAIADLNHDGKPDLVTANVGGSVSVLLGVGNGTFGAKRDFTVGTSPLSLAIGDLNGDSEYDLAVANSMSNTVSVLLGRGDGTFEARTDYGTGQKPVSVAIGDLDGDGAPDLAAADLYANKVSVLRGNGGGTFQARTDFTVSLNPHAVAIGDFTGDGRPDLAVANNAANSVSVLINDSGAGSSTALIAAPSPSSVGQPVVLTATVTPDSATGTVVFQDGPAALGTAPIVGGVATLTVSNLSKGVHPLIATYSGDAVYHGSASAALIQAVEAAGTSTAIASSANPSVFRQPVRFTATVVATPPGAGHPSGTVQFRIDDADFGAPVALSGGSATSASTTALSVGLHEVQAVYSGDPNYLGSASPVLADTVVTSSPVIAGVRDVPNDQGGRVFLTWRCALDAPGVPVVTGYRIWRRVPDPVSAATIGTDSGVEPAPAAFRRISTVARDGSVTETFWEAIATLPSAQLISYGYTAATTQDSMAGSNPLTVLFVQALTADPFEFYASAPDSGYSVDNLSPAQPAPFAALYGRTGVALHWGVSAEGDLREYRLYRDTSPNFTPGPDNLLLAQPDTGYFDAGGSSAFAYKLSAMDVHGNESRFALVTPNGATGALASLLSADVEGTVVHLRWLAAANPGLSARVYRRTPESAWTALGPVTADGTGIMAWNDAQVSLGRRYGYRLGIWDGGAEVFLGETWIEIPLLTFALEGVRPNPSRGAALMVSFSLPSDQPALLELFDLSGRRLLGREVGSLGPGQHRIDAGAGETLRAGVYVLRLTQGQQRRSLKAVVVR